MEIQKTFTKIEEKFNFAGSIPVVGILSGALRILAGAVQSVVSGIIGLFALIGMLFDSKSRKWEDISSACLESFAHGGMNIIRGFSEYLLGLTLVGSGGLLAYQLSTENKFQPMIKYRETPEAQPESEIPLD